MTPTGLQPGTILKQPETSLGMPPPILAKSNGQNSVKHGDKLSIAHKRHPLNFRARDDVGFVAYDFNLCSSQIEL